MKPIGPQKIIEKKENFLFPCSHHFYHTPPQIVRGDMQYLYDHENKKYLDFFAGVSVVNCGHCNPKIVNATVKQLINLQHTTTIYLTQPIVDLAEKLAEVLPGDIRRSFFCCTGSEANEGALLLARLHTQKNKFIALSNGLHGRTYLTMSATQIPMWRADPNLISDIIFAPTFYNKEKCLDDAAQDSLDAIEKIILDNGPNSFAGLIAEPIQGNGGIITPPQWYFKKLKSLLEKHNILLIIDEVQTGFARTGKMFAIENFDVVPDIITMAKALGNGVPISAFSTTDHIAASFTKASASTLGGNPVACETAIAVLDYMDQHKLCEHAKTLGDYLKKGLLHLQKKHALIHDIRGIGLMLGAELLKSNGNPAVEETDYILEALKNEGILLGKNGLDRNVLAFQPPLIITQEDIDFLLNTLDGILSHMHDS